MKKVYALFLFLSASLLCPAQPSFDWVQGLIGADKAGVTDGNSVTTDAAGNVYATGHFNGTMDFDPGPGVMNITTPAATDYTFIWKLDPSGNLVWARVTTGNGICMGNSVATDAAGNCFITGSFNGTFDFDPGAGIYNMTATSTNNMFLMELDAAGNFVFATALQGGGSDYSTGTSVIADNGGNIYYTGYFIGSADFDPGPGVYTMSATTGQESFIVKLDAGAHLVWAEATENSSIAATTKSIGLDAAGNILLSGNFSGRTDFNPGPGVDTMSTLSWNPSMFVMKLGNSGSFLWAKAVAGNGNAYSVRADAGGNIYTTGYFNGSVDFDPGPGTSMLSTGSSGTNSMYVLKLDAAGNYAWAVKTSGSPTEASSLSLDAAANVYITGCFKGTVDFDPGAGSYNLTAVSGALGNNIFVLKLDAAGGFVWAAGMGGLSSPDDRGYSVAVYNSSEIYTLGMFRGTVDFDPGPGTASLAAVGSNSMFLQKLHKGISNDIAETATENAISIYPNPAGDIVTVVNITTPATVTVYDVTGQVLQSQQCRTASLRLDLHAQAAGVYFVRVTTSAGSLTRKLLKQ